MSTATENFSRGDCVQVKGWQRAVWGKGVIVDFCKDGRAQVKFGIDMYCPCGEIVFIGTEYLEKAEKR